MDDHRVFFSPGPSEGLIEFMGGTNRVMTG